MRNRRHRHLMTHNVDSEGSWAISYGDMVTLLLTFFIIFFSHDKFKMEKSLNLHLDVMAKNIQASREIATVIEKSSFVDKKVKDEIDGKVHRDGQKVLVEFSGVSFFKSAATELTPKAKKTLDQFMKVYSPYMGKYNIGIRAFTDPRKVRSDHVRFQDNLELSALRSVSVMRYFQKSGIPLTHMKISGYGELTLSGKDTEVLPEGERTPSSVNDLARTTVLIIEPREEL